MDITKKKPGKQNLKMDNMEVLNTQLQQEIQKRKRIEEELRLLTAYIQHVREKERKKIAQEIHDELGQILTVLKLDLYWTINRVPSGNELVTGKLNSMTDIINSALKSIQRMSSELRPRILDDFGLVPALEWQVKEFIEHSKIDCEILNIPEKLEIEQERSIAFFRIFQEILTNIMRHSLATLVKINIEIIDEIIILEVIDNGRGITKDVLYNPNSIGLIGIRERTNYLGGSVAINSLPDGGTKVTIRAPLSSWDR